MLFRSQGREYDKAYMVYVEAVKGLLADNDIQIRHHELRLVDKGSGYAGTTDADFVSPKLGGYGILDFKTCKTIPDKKTKPRDTWPMQIAAYFVTHYGKLPSTAEHIGINIAISTTEPGRVELITYDGIELHNEWIKFYHINEYYKLSTGHYPVNKPAKEKYKIGRAHV